MNFLNFLKNNTNTRKIFGERELKIIEKQLFGIRLTQSEKNRLSRDIRKKFEFIKDAGKFSEEFQLKKAQNTKALIQRARNIILQHPLSKKIKRIILFGSFIENQLTVRSDIDIAVDFSEITKKEAFDFSVSVGAKCGDKVDIEAYNFLPNKIREQADKKGRVLYERESQ